MKTNSEEPRLRESLRRPYRAAEVSPYLARRVIANLDTPGRSSPVRLMLAGGLSSLLVAAVLLAFMVNHQDSANQGPATGNALVLDLPELGRTTASLHALKVPGPGQLSRVPGLNQFNTPPRSLYTPGDICIYSPKGEMSC